MGERPGALDPTPLDALGPVDERVGETRVPEIDAARCGKHRFAKLFAFEFDLNGHIPRACSLSSAPLCHHTPSVPSASLTPTLFFDCLLLRHHSDYPSPLVFRCLFLRCGQENV